MSAVSHAEARAMAALKIMEGQPALGAEVMRLTDDFFARHPDLEQSRFAVAFIASLMLEQLSQPQSQSQSQSQSA